MRLASWDEVTLPALWVCCLSVEPPCLAHYTLHALRILRMVPDIWCFARSCGSRPAVPGQGLDVCTSTPMKLGALRPLLQWQLGCSSPGLQIFLNAHTVRPPDWGGIWYIKPSRHCYQQKQDNSLSAANFDLLDEHIWVDAERGGLIKLNVQPSICDIEAAHFCFDFQVSQMSWWVINFAGFCGVAQWLIRCVLWQILFVVVACLGSCPVFCLVCCFFVTKRKSGWGICGSSWLVALFVFCFDLICPLLWTLLVLVQMSFWLLMLM